MDRTILHVDANSFFASCECAMDPSLKGKPVAVVGDAAKRSGIILAANYEAKKHGVKTAEAIWQAENKCPDLIMRRSKMERYLEYSDRLMKILLSYSDYVEPFGCDEAWVELKGMLSGKGRETAENIRLRVKKELDITVSIGISFNKVFAKLGSDLKKPDAITEVMRDNFKQKIWPLPVETLLYVGKYAKTEFNRRAIYTIGDLAMTDKELVITWLGKTGAMIYEYANGKDNSPVEAYDNIIDEKSVSISKTFPRDLASLKEIKTAFMYLAEEIAERMRYKSVKGWNITIKVRDCDLNWTSHGCKIDHPTNISREISKYAIRLFEEAYDAGDGIRSLGISIGSLTDDLGGMQMDLLGDSKKLEKLAKLDRVSDDLKKRFGENAIFKANRLYNDIIW